MYFGPLEGYEQDGLRLVSHGENPDSPGIHLVLQWDAPLQSLFPIGADSDTLLHHGKMVDIARQSAENRQDAIHKAQSAIGMYITPGWTRWDALWLWPAVGNYGPERGLEDARTKARQRNLSVQEFGNEAWQEQLRKRVDVSRAWGPLGLFWALLVAQLEQGLRLSECENCHRRNFGKKGKRFCGPDDDPACYTQRRARDKRNERAH
jgi:hypothetical protein